MSLIEVVAAALLVLGSALVIHAVWAADRAAGPAESPRAVREDEAPVRRAA